MNYLSAMLLLALGRDEEDAFWVLVSLIDDEDEGELLCLLRAKVWRRRRQGSQGSCAAAGGSSGGVLPLAQARCACHPTGVHVHTLGLASLFVHGGAVRLPRCVRNTAIIVAAFCAGLLYRDMYARDLTGTHVEMRCLRELVGRKLPRLGAHLDDLACDMSILATGGCGWPPACSGAAQAWQSCGGRGDSRARPGSVGLLSLQRDTSCRPNLLPGSPPSRCLPQTGSSASSAPACRPGRRPACGTR